MNTEYDRNALKAGFFQLEVVKGLRIYELTNGNDTNNIENF